MEGKSRRDGIRSSLGRSDGLSIHDLDLKNNRLTTLPRELARIHTFNSLELGNNPWAEPLASVMPKPPYCPNIEAIYACLGRL